MLKPREAVRPEDRVTLAVRESVTAAFGMRYLAIFAQAAPLNGTVEFRFGPGAVLVVKYDLEHSDNGFMQFYLAPKWSG